MMRAPYLTAIALFIVVIQAQLLCKGTWFQECAFVDMPNRDKFLQTCMNLKDIYAPGIEAGSLERNVMSYKVPPDRLCLFHKDPCYMMQINNTDYLDPNQIVHKLWPGTSLTNISQRADWTAINATENASERGGKELTNDQKDAAGQMVSIRCSRRMYMQRAENGDRHDPNKGKIKDRDVKGQGDDKSDWYGSYKHQLRGWFGEKWDEKKTEGCGTEGYFDNDKCRPPESSDP